MGSGTAVCLPASPPFALIMCHYGMFLPHALPHLGSHGPLKAGRMGHRAGAERMMDTESLLVREDHSGQEEEGGGPGPAPVLPQHLLIIQTLAEEQSQGTGEGLSEQP